jgi:phosphoribosylaminoimidazole-succinocarboxamide synthase
MTQYKRTVDHATSVKRIGIIEEPTTSSDGVADFTFNPVFSVFDYGTIQPAVPLDNSTICTMGGFNFELLREQGIPTHYLALVTPSGEEISAREAIAQGIAPNTMRVRFVNRLMPEFKNGVWDYSKFGSGIVNNYVQPIEFISRNELPESASVWKRIKEGKLTLADLGLPADFKPGMAIPDAPLLDFTTKFEKGDKPLTPAQAQAYMGIDDVRFNRMSGITRRASRLMTDYAASRGFKRLDGKVEYVVVPTAGVPTDMLGDAVCTWHEDRLLYGSTGISKQRIRDKIKALNPEWAAEIDRAKKQAEQEGVKDFRELMDQAIKYNSPSPEFFQGINALFQAATNQWVGSRLYVTAPGKTDSLEDGLARAIEEFQKVK